jgi:hypothetical protein
MFVFGQRVLNRTSEPKKGEITRNQGKLHNEELHYLHSLPDYEIMLDEMDRAYSMHENKEKCRQNFIGKP